MLIQRIAASVSLLLLGAAAWAEVPADKVRAQVQQAAREQLLRQAAGAGWVEPLFELAVVHTSRPLPSCRQAVKVEAIGAGNPARMRFAALCPGADGWRYEMLVRASVTAMVVVTAPEAAGRCSAPSSCGCSGTTFPARLTASRPAGAGRHGQQSTLRRRRTAPEPAWPRL
jgi:hypothetical protein